MPAGNDNKDLTRRIDIILLHPVFSYLIFAAVLWFLFTLTFKLGSLPMAGIRTSVDWVGHVLVKLLPGGFGRNLLVDGIMAGAGGVLIFLPNIVILFLGISIMEETGYMARVAWIMDRIMHRMGLHGRSFLPIIMGLGCNVPAMLAARSIKSTRDRILTVLIAPLISCSARHPIYVLFVGAFFPGHAVSMIFLMYMISFIAVFTLGALFRKTLFRGKGECEAVYELPPYRRPRLKKILMVMWLNTKHYLNRIGTVVIFFSALLYILSHYPESEHQKIENSYIGRIGALIEPLLKPAGFDLKLDISVITGFAAKEMVVGTLGVLHSVDQGHAAGQYALQDILRNEYSPLTAFAFMLFSLLYTPCIASLVTLIREVRSWKWSIFGLVYPLVLAWVAAVTVRQMGLLMGLS
ncbi:MAG: ferrous iron transport protein B [Fibrobacterota bacterium]